jgi:hypothetical protein
VQFVAPLLIQAVHEALRFVVGANVWNSISNFFRCGGVVSQAASFDDLPKLMATLFTFSVFKGGVKPMVIAEFCRRIATLDRMSGGWDSFLNWLLKAIDTCVNCGRDLFGLDRIKLYTDANESALKWAREVNAVCLRTMTSGDDTTQVIDEMMRLMTLGYEFKNIYRTTSMARFIDDAFVRLCNAMMPYHGAISARNNFRFEPAACMLLGAPGIGKTLMATFFCAAVMLEGGLLPADSPPEDVIKNIWAKGTSEFWNGYANQLTLVIDDAF